MGIDLTDKLSFRSSILFRLSFFFLVILLLGVFIGNYLYTQMQVKQYERAKADVEMILNILRQSVLIPHVERKAAFERKGFRVIENDVAIANRIKNTPPVQNDLFDTKQFSGLRDGRLVVGFSLKQSYVYVTQATPAFMVLTSSLSNIRDTFLAVGSFLFFALILLYFSIVHSLLPLKRLAKAIERFGETGESFSSPIQGRDEIAFVSRAFEKAVQKNRALSEARHLFLRNIMHELKTPITAGKVAVAMQEESTERDIVERAFLRMEHLIAEMARVEQVTSQLLRPTLQDESLESLIELVCEELIIDTEQLQISGVKNWHIRCDSGMMKSIIKNLVDNAIKYASDTRVSIVKTSKSLEFVSRGDAWPEEQRFETLLEPFVHASGTQLRRSFGLGLYIVNAMARSQGMHFTHRYEGGCHRFCIEDAVFTMVLK